MCTYEDGKEKLKEVLNNMKEEKNMMDNRFDEFKGGLVNTSLYNTTERVILSVGKVMVYISSLTTIYFAVSMLMDKKNSESNLISTLLFLFFSLLLGGIYYSVKHLTDTRIKSYTHDRDYTILESVRPYKFSCRGYGSEIVDNGKGLLFMLIQKNSMFKKKTEWYQCGLINYETGRVLMKIPLTYISPSSKEYITMIDSYRKVNNLD